MCPIRSLPLLCYEIRQEKELKMSRRLSDEERKFLETNYIARIATVSRKAYPHVSPVYYANDADSVYFTTATTTVKFRDLSENSRVSLVVDVFDADWLHGVKGSSKTYEKAVVIIGIAEVHFNGDLYMKMYADLLNKYPDYNDDLHWEPGELPIIRIAVEQVISWGIK